MSVLGSGFVLFTGLVSCSKEDKTTDIYRTKPPVIRSGGASQDLKTWSLLKNKEFDLQDVLDFTESSPARVEMKSSCKSGNDFSYGSAVFAGGAPIQIWQVLPFEVLTQNLTTKKFACSFELNLYNGVGSNHIYTVESVPIVERLESAAKIAIDGKSEMPKFLTPVQMLDVRVRYSNSASSAIRLICEDMETNLLPFEQVIDLAHFDFAKPNIRPTRSRDVLETHPTQNCRAFIVQQGRAAGLSNLVQIILPRSLFTILKQDRLYPEYIPENPNLNRFPLDEINAGRAISISAWTLKNNDPVRRYLRVPKFRAYMDAQILKDVDAERRQLLMNYHIQMVSLIAQVPADRKQDLGNSFRKTIEPLGTVTFHATFQSLHPSTCGSPIAGISITGVEPFAVDEVGADGNVMNTLTLQVPPLKIFAVDPEKVKTATAVYRCEWF